ncbi:MAG TPA: NAD-dependent epimerase/dehydratase family protein [Tepidisphaeraceae bacterium]|nr:NAD-dependent epimerase/dehydratase family protein [Tepidisphaeraceae bacterium]
MKKVAEMIGSVEELEEMLSEPSEAAVGAMSRLKGDILFLGVAGKMGPTLARMAVRASEMAGVKRKVIGVARFSNAEERPRLEKMGVETIKCDLLDREELEKLPDVANVVYMPAMKFGSTNQEALTWAMNTFLAGECARKYRKSKIVAFSTGNVYGLSPVVRGGSLEGDVPGPAGDYAMSCLGRERMFEHFSRVNGTEVALIRLNYAMEMRYGVLVDVAKRVWAGEVIDLAMGNFNVIWQGDANAMTLAAFDQVGTPPFVVNVAGPEMLSMRVVCERYGKLMGKDVKFTGGEAGDALLSNGQLGHRLYGYPRVSADQMMVWIAKWVMGGGKDIGKPTHFEARDGRY